MFVTVLIFSLVSVVTSISGLHKACDVVKKPINLNSLSNDIVLSGVTNRLEAAAYKLQVLRMRLGHAWEWVFTDFGFTKLSKGLDLINHRRRIAIELKNGYRINSIVRREDYRRLRKFKAQHPGYRVILGIINDKTIEGKVRVKNRVYVMTGQRFLRYIFKGREGGIIRSLRSCVRKMV